MLNNQSTAPTTNFTRPKSAFKIPRNINTKRLIAYAGIVLSIISVLIVLIFGGILLFGSGPSSPGSVIVRISLTPTPLISPFVIVSKVPVNNTAHFAMKLNGGTSESGSLWLVDPATLNRTAEQIEIVSILSWSPDNNYLAVTTKNAQGQVNYAVYDKNQKKLLSSNLKFVEKSQTVWASNNLLAIVDYSDRDSLQLFSISVPEMTLKNQAIGSKLQADFLAVSSTLNSFILLNGIKANLFESDSNTLHDLVAEKIMIGTQFNPGNWIDSYRFAFYDYDGLFLLDDKNNTVRQLLTLKSSDTNPYNSNEFKLSANKENLYFMFTGILYRYNFASRNTKTIFDIKGNSDLQAQVSFEILPNELGAVLSGKDKSYLLEFSSQKLDTLCETTCQQVAVEN